MKINFPLWLKGIPFAMTMLTRFPLPFRWMDARAMPWSTAWYPMVGWIVGLLCGIPVYLLAIRSLSAPVNPAVLWAAPVFWVGLSAYLTRGFHFDGWCDCCDALMANTNCAGRRRILKDLHAGSGAVLGGVFLISGKLLILLALCVSLFSFGAVSPLNFALMLAVPPVMGRFFVTALAYAGRPSGDGLSAGTVGKIPLMALVVAAGTLFPVLWILPGHIFGILLLLGGMTALWWYLKAEAAFEGINGDVLGACEESVELVLFTALLVIR